MMLKKPWEGCGGGVEESTSLGRVKLGVTFEETSVVVPQSIPSISQQISYLSGLELAVMAEKNREPRCLRESEWQNAS